MVTQRRDGAAGRDPEPGLDHAAEHDAEPERARGVRHPDRLADAARLRQLDVDPVRDLSARSDAVEPVAVLVDVDRDRRALLQRPPALVARAERLLAVRDPELGELRQRLQRLVERPPLVDVHLQRQVGDGADGAHALDVEPVGTAELQLQPPEAGAAFSARRAMSSGSPSQTVQEVGGPRPRQAQQLPDRDAEQLALEVVERAVERRPGGVLVPPAAAPRSPRARTGRRRAAARAPRRRRAPSAAVSS